MGDDHCVLTAKVGKITYLLPVPVKLLRIKLTPYHTFLALVVDIRHTVVGVHHYKGGHDLVPLANTYYKIAPAKLRFEYGCGCIQRLYIIEKR